MIQLRENDKVFICYIADNGAHKVEEFDDYYSGLDRKREIEEHSDIFVGGCDIFDKGESVLEFPEGEKEGCYRLVYNYGDGYSFLDIDVSGATGWTLEELYDEFTLMDSEWKEYEKNGCYLFKV